MLKKYAYLLLMAIFASALFTACDDDDNPITNDDQIEITSVSFGGNEGIFATAGDEVTINGAYFGNTTGSILLSSEDEGADYSDAQTATTWQDTQIKFDLPETLEAGSYSVKITRVNPAEDEEFYFIVGDGPNNVGAITAISMSATSVRLAWPMNAYEDNANLFTEYMVTYDDGTGEKSKSSTTSQVTIDSLQPNTAVDFNVWVVYADGSVSDTITKTWAGADRLPVSAGTPAMLFSSASSDEGSGLQVWDDIEGKLMVRKVANGKLWNYGLDTKTAGKVWFGSARSLQYNFPETPALNGMIMAEPGTTENLGFFYASSLDDWDGTNIEYNTDLSTFSYLTGAVDLNTLKSAQLTEKGGVMMIGRIPAAGSTDEYNYVRMFIDYDETNESWLFNDGNGSEEFDHLRVYISYQSDSSVPYAGK